jgi:hypothetical protein
MAFADREAINRQLPRRPGGAGMSNENTTGVTAMTMIYASIGGASHGTLRHRVS